MAKSGCGEEDIQENDIPFVSKKTFFGSDKETCRPEESDVGAFGNTSTNQECAFIGRYRRSKEAERSYTDFSCLVVLTLFSPGFFGIARNLEGRRRPCSITLKLANIVMATKFSIVTSHCKFIG